MARYLDNAWSEDLEPGREHGLARMFGSFIGLAVLVVGLLFIVLAGAFSKRSKAIQLDQPQGNSASLPPGTDPLS
jgi:hypothetical protein